MRTIVLSALALSLAMPAAAQRPISPEERIERLERQTRQIQRRIFPQGQPVDTAGVADDPAASQIVVVALSNRIDNLERQLAEMTRVAQENGTRVATLEAELARSRSDLERRLRDLENAPRAAAPATGTVSDPDAPRRVQPRAEPATKPAAPKPADPSGSTFVADGEAAYDAGFQLWTQKKYDQAITALRAMASSFPGHRRVSWANNLVGRSLLDKGEPRAAAEALLANYRGNPKGERAPDSLFYLGQALVALKQAGQACKAYAELEEVYGANMRGELKSLLPGAKSRAGC
ncbi:hypothetical protein ACFQPG_03830 [Sphingomonas sp. GCM10030256]|uniref:hypothetical protein n=1 Tax=Sphingomonas sp. GCM10030256 TaxID=3273427 RepID=UPI0036095E80